MRRGRDTRPHPHTLLKRSIVLLALWNTKLRIMRVALIALTILYASLVMLSVVLRYLFSTTIIGIEELATYSALWAYFLGAAFGSYGRSHISASLVPVLFTRKTPRALAEMLATSLTLLIAAAMSWHIWHYVAWSLSERPRSLELHTSLVWFHAAMLVGFVLMTLYALLELLDQILLLCGRQPLPISPLRVAEAKE
jgi:TRAP-type C4-dicarboxylate transport system permease small subunit